MNHTTTQPAIEAAQHDPTTAGLILLGLAFITFMLGLFAGALASRPNIPRARVRLRALKAYLSSGVADDELVQSLLKLDIRRLEQRLKLDEDQD